MKDLSGLSEISPVGGVSPKSLDLLNLPWRSLLTVFFFAKRALIRVTPPRLFSPLQNSLLIVPLCFFSRKSQYLSLLTSPKLPPSTPFLFSLCFFFVFLGPPRSQKSGTSRTSPSPTSLLLHRFFFPSRVVRTATIFSLNYLQNRSSAVPLPLLQNSLQAAPRTAAAPNVPSFLLKMALLSVGPSLQRLLFSCPPRKSLEDLPLVLLLLPPLVGCLSAFFFFARDIRGGLAPRLTLKILAFILKYSSPPTSFLNQALSIPRFLLEDPPPPSPFS